MNSEIPTPTRPFSEDHNWPRHRPVFSLLAFFIAVACGAGIFAWQYKARWTPLQRYYFQTYVRTDHLSHSRNRFIRPVGSYLLLSIVYPKGTRIAVDSEVSPATAPPGSSSHAVAFRLSPAAIQNGAKGLFWQSVKIDDFSLHGWLSHWIYGVRSLWQLCRSSWYAGLLMLVILLPFAIRKDRRESRKRRQGFPLKGAHMVSRSQYHRQRRDLTGVGWVTTDGASLWERASVKKEERKVVRVARKHETEHFLFAGDTGTGKSSLIRQLLIQVRDRKETAIVYDPAREYLPQFFDPERGDVVLNPLDARMPYWAPADELLHHAEADTLAKSLYPDRDRENRFFVESPRKIFAHLLKYRPTPEELCHWIANPDPEIDRRVARTPLDAIISKAAPQQRSGVLSGLERVSSIFELLPRPSNNARRWLATEWAENRTGWLFLTTTPETRERTRPLLSLWLDFLILRLTAQNDYGLRPVWVILDELASLETLPTLPLALTESRKSNTRIVLGLQGRSQVEFRYGREAEAMLSQPSTRIFLRTSEPRAAEWVSKCIGDVEIEHLREGRTSSYTGLYANRNGTVDRRIEAAILASEISNLENLTGYFQTPGYTLKLNFPYFTPESHHPALIRRDVPDSYSIAIPAVADPTRSREAQTQTVGPGKDTAQTSLLDNVRAPAPENDGGDNYSISGER